VIDRRVRGQGLAELALALPGLLLMLMITLGIGVVMRADAGVAAVASEAARSGALASDARQAAEDAQARANTVADGYGLTNGSLGVAIGTSDFRRGGSVRVLVTYSVPVSSLPLLGWANVTLRHEAAEPIAPNRSFR
jgi:Flp pilus assembly protein TadG